MRKEDETFKCLGKLLDLTKKIVLNSSIYFYERKIYLEP